MTIDEMLDQHRAEAAAWLDVAITAALRETNDSAFRDKLAKWKCAKLDELEALLRGAVGRLH